MTHNIPQFYNQWMNDNLGLSPSPDFVYHKGEQYAYLIMGGPEDAPGNLFIFVFSNADNKEPKYLKMHRIQATEVVNDPLEKLLDSLKKDD